MQYPGNRCQKLEVCMNFRVAQEFKILEHFEIKLQKVCENEIFKILEDLWYYYI